MSMRGRPPGNSLTAKMAVLARSQRSYKTLIETMKLLLTEQDGTKFHRAMMRLDNGEANQFIELLKQAREFLQLEILINYGLPVVFEMMTDVYADYSKAKQKGFKNKVDRMQLIDCYTKLLKVVGQVNLTQMSVNTLINNTPEEHYVVMHDMRQEIIKMFGDIANKNVTVDVKPEDNTYGMELEKSNGGSLAHRDDGGGSSSGGISSTESKMGDSGANSGGAHGVVA
jgi:hypothetical protein